MVYSQSYDANLNPGTSWPAHTVQIFALAAGGGKVYSSSNDGGVKVWTTEGQKITELPHNEVDIAAVTISGTDVITGDEDGNVSPYLMTTTRVAVSPYKRIPLVQA